MGQEKRHHVYSTGDIGGVPTQEFPRRMSSVGRSGGIKGALGCPITVGRRTKLTRKSHKAIGAVTIGRIRGADRLKTGGCEVEGQGRWEF